MLNARRVRESLGLSLTAVMRATPLDIGQLSRWERGQLDMRGRFIKALANFYNSRGAGITIDDLLREATPDPAAEAQPEAVAVH